MLLKLGYVRDLNPTWDEEIAWCSDNFRGSSCMTTIKKLAFIGFVYHIWRERNNRVFRTQSNSIEQVSMIIVQDIRLKMTAKIHKEVENHNVRWFMERWKVDCQFIRVDLIYCTWLAPSIDEVMMNSDGSLRDESGGFGAILRISNGDVLDAACGGYFPNSVMAHELQGVELV